MKFKIFVINLDSSKGRWSKIKSQLDEFKLEYERIPAVDGKLISSSNKMYDSSKNRTHFHINMSKGEIGCYLSHIKCWKKIIDEKLDYAIIIEDDVKILQDLSKIKELLNANLFPEWDYIKIGETPIRRNSRVVKKIEDYSIVKYSKKVPTGAFGQIVSYEGSKKLLEYSNPFYRPVDVDFQYTWENNLTVLGIKPYFVDAIKHQSDISDIGDRKKGKKRIFIKITNIIKEYFQILFYR